jgi:LAO/AO transport system kinase
VSSIAVKGEGIDELWNAIQKHRSYQEEEGLLGQRRRRRIGREIKSIVVASYRQQVDAEAAETLDGLVEEVASRRLDPYEAAARIRESM